MMMQPEVVSREIIKPSSSSPKNHPTIHNLSFFDQLQSRIYMPLLFFYTSKNGENDHHDRSSVLKTSISAALLDYYPLAGRIKDYATVDCNDGVLFLEARMECDLSEVILKNPDDEILKHLLPGSLCYKETTSNGPVAAQVTYFQCGGMSIGLCLCHKILDTESMSSFIKKWASMAQKSDREVRPQFNIGSLYPPLDLPFLKQHQPPPQEMKNFVSKRLVFDGEKIAKLKAMVADLVPNPTRVEVVTALLYKSANFAAAKASSSLKPSVMNHAMNLRTRISPLLSEGLIGNLFWVFPVKISEDKEVDLVRLVKEFKHEKIRFSNSYAKTCESQEELYSVVLESLKSLENYFSGGNEEEEVYLCSSWCRFPFYEADFGWGRPFWVTMVFWAIKNMIIMLDTKGGDGIEAFICLEEKVMAVFEHDQQLLSFCSINPCSDLEI